MFSSNTTEKIKKIQSYLTKEWGGDLSLSDDGLVTYKGNRKNPLAKITEDEDGIFFKELRCVTRVNASTSERKDLKEDLGYIFKNIK